MSKGNRPLTKDNFSRETAGYLLELYKLSQELPSPQKWANQDASFYYGSDLHDALWLQQMISWSLEATSAPRNHAQRKLRWLSRRGQLMHQLEELCLLDMLVAMYNIVRQWDALNFQSSFYAREIANQAYDALRDAEKYLPREHAAVEQLYAAKSAIQDAYGKVESIKYRTTNGIWQLAHEILRQVFLPVPEAWKVTFLDTFNPGKFAHCADLRNHLQPCRRMTAGSYLQRAAELQASAAVDYKATCQHILAADLQLTNAMAFAHQAANATF